MPACFILASPAFLYNPQIIIPIYFIINKKFAIIPPTMKTTPKKSPDDLSDTRRLLKEAAAHLAATARIQKADAAKRKAEAAERKAEAAERKAETAERKAEREKDAAERKAEAAERKAEREKDAAERKEATAKFNANHKKEMARIKAEGKQNTANHKEEMARIEAERKQDAAKHKEEMARLDKELAEAEVRLKNTEQQIGALDDGLITEEDVFYAVKKAGMICDIPLDYVEHDVRSPSGDQFDLVGTNGKNIVVMEVKRTLKQEDIVWFAKDRMAVFAQEFSGAIGKKKLLGAMIYRRRISEKVAAVALDNGLLLAHAKGKKGLRPINSPAEVAPSPRKIVANKNPAKGKK